MNKTSIEWTDYTWNPVTGCNKVSQGCKLCYAEVLTKRFGKTWGTGKFTDVKIHPERLLDPLKKQKAIAGKKVFVCDMSDLFHESVPFRFIYSVWAKTFQLQHTTFQILTKRPARLLEFVQYMRDMNVTWPGFSPNVWIGVSCEDQKAADERVPLLLKVPASVRFLSCEPLIGPIDLTRIAPSINWVICGGESGRSARPMHPDWARFLRDQCSAAGVPFFFKQWGEWLPLEFDAQPPYRRFASNGRLIDGHGIDIMDPKDPLGKPGKYAGRSFMDAMEAIVFCDELKVSHCDFLKKGNKLKFKPMLDGKRHLEFPSTGNKYKSVAFEGDQGPTMGMSY